MLKLFFSSIAILINISLLFSNAIAEEYSKQANKYAGNEFELKYFTGEIRSSYPNPTLIGLGIGGHKTINNARAVGFYLSGMIPISGSNLGIYGRGELIRDRDKIQQTWVWSWKAALGIGYYFSQDFIPYINLAQCYPSQTSCYDIPLPKGITERERDTDTIYLGLGGFFKMPLTNQHFEISIDWSPYSNHNNRSIYLGYAFALE